MLFADPHNFARISDCGRYRYQLGRQVTASASSCLVNPGTVAYFGINPSTADGSIDDATIRKLREFTRREGFGRLLVGNVFAFRATDVRELQRAADPVGPENHEQIGRIIAAADVLVPCWGNRQKVPPRLRHHVDELLQRLNASGKPVKVFGLSQGGDPLHPLMLGYATRLVAMTATRTELI